MACEMIHAQEINNMVVNLKMNLQNTLHFNQNNTFSCH